MSSNQFFALVVQQDKSLKLESHELPTAGAGEILVKNVAVALNPTDWKNIEYGYAGHQKVVGSDFAGIVEAVGRDVKNWRVGDKVAGFLQGGLEDYHGGFQNFVRTPADLAYRIPDNLSFEEAASISLASQTAGLGLRRLFNYPDAPPRNSSILVWGGSTSVGQYAIQLAKLAGLTVFATASKHNHELLKSFGADHILDRHDKDFANKVRAVVPNGVDFLFDTASEKETTKLALQALKKNGAVALTLPLNTDEFNRPDVKFHIFLVYQIFGRNVDTFELHMEASREDRAFGAQFYQTLETLLASRKLKPNPIKVQPNGLSGIPDGLKQMKEGKPSGYKFVYRIEDTPKQAL